MVSGGTGKEIGQKLIAVASLFNKKPSTLPTLLFLGENSSGSIDDINKKCEGYILNESDVLKMEKLDLLIYNQQKGGIVFYTPWK